MGQSRAEKHRSNPTPSNKEIERRLHELHITGKENQKSNTIVDVRELEEVIKLGVIRLCHKIIGGSNINNTIHLILDYLQRGDYTGAIRKAQEIALMRGRTLKNNSTTKESSTTNDSTKNSKQQSSLTNKNAQNQNKLNTTNINVQNTHQSTGSTSNRNSSNASNNSSVTRTSTGTSLNSSNKSINSNYDPNIAAFLRFVTKWNEYTRVNGGDYFDLGPTGVDGQDGPRTKNARRYLWDAYTKYIDYYKNPLNSQKTFVDYINEAYKIPMQSPDMLPQYEYRDVEGQVPQAPEGGYLQLQLNMPEYERDYYRSSGSSEDVESLDNFGGVLELNLLYLNTPDYLRLYELNMKDALKYHIIFKNGGLINNGSEIKVKTKMKKSLIKKGANGIYMANTGFTGSTDDNYKYDFDKNQLYTEADIKDLYKKAFYYKYSSDYHALKDGKYLYPELHKNDKHGFWGSIVNGFSSSGVGADDMRRNYDIWWKANKNKLFSILETPNGNYYKYIYSPTNKQDVLPAKPTLTDDWGSRDYMKKGGKFLVKFLNGGSTVNIKGVGKISVKPVKVKVVDPNTHKPTTITVWVSQDNGMWIHHNDGTWGRYYPSKWSIANNPGMFKKSKSYEDMMHTNSYDPNKATSPGDTSLNPGKPATQNGIPYSDETLSHLNFMKAYNDWNTDDATDVDYGLNIFKNNGLDGRNGTYTQNAWKNQRVLDAWNAYNTAVSNGTFVGNDYGKFFTDIYKGNNPNPNASKTTPKSDDKTPIVVSPLDKMNEIAGNLTRSLIANRFNKRYLLTLGLMYNGSLESNNLYDPNSPTPNKNGYYYGINMRGADGTDQQLNYGQALLENYKHLYGEDSHRYKVLYNRLTNGKMSNRYWGKVGRKLAESLAFDNRMQQFGAYGQQVYDSIPVKTSSGATLPSRIGPTKPVISREAHPYPTYRSLDNYPEDSAVDTQPTDVNTVVEDVNNIDWQNYHGGTDYPTK